MHIKTENYFVNYVIKQTAFMWDFVTLNTRSIHIWRKEFLLINFTILEKYHSLVPALKESEYKQLEQSIKEKGLWVPIIINKDGVILDGHHRYYACMETNTKINTIERNFDTKLDEEIFVLECNAKRRQLDDLGKHKIYEHLKPRYEKLAKERQLEAGKNYGENHPKSLRANARKLSTSKEKESSNSSTQAAQQTNLSRAKAEKMDYIKENDPELYDQIGKTDRMTVNKAYTTTKKNKKREKRHKEIKKLQVKLPKKVTLYNQDFATVPIKDNSISLIFTDPPYHEKYLPLFGKLSKHAGKVLKEGGSLITYCGHFNIGKVINMMEDQGLKFHWIISVVHSGPSASVFARKILVGWKPMLWFTKGKYEGEFVRDLIKSEFQGKEVHDWAQSTVEADYYIKYLTIPNEIVYDPFLGSGTFGISAIKQKRQFIGVEIDKDHFENARRLISNAYQS